MAKGLPETAETLIQYATDRGFTVTADGDKLRVRGPRNAGDEIPRALIARKAAILAYLRPVEPVPQPVAIDIIDAPQASPADAQRLCQPVASPPPRPIRGPIFFITDSPRFDMGEVPALDAIPDGATYWCCAGDATWTPVVRSRFDE